MMDLYKIAPVQKDCMKLGIYLPRYERSVCQDCMVLCTTPCCTGLLYIASVTGSLYDRCCTAHCTAAFATTPFVQPFCTASVQLHRTVALIQFACSADFVELHHRTRFIQKNYKFCTIDIVRRTCTGHFTFAAHNTIVKDEQEEAGSKNKTN